MKDNRKPASIERIGGLTKRDRIWKEIRVQREFTAASLIAAVTEMQNSSIHHYLRCLCAGGYLEADKTQKPARYVLIKDCGVESPRLRQDGSVITQGRINENLWRTMKILKIFDWMDLSRFASTPDVMVKPQTAKHYIETLHKAKYLICLRPSSPGVRATYRMLSSMNTGGRAPMIQRDRSLYDPNLGKIVFKRGQNNESKN